MESSFRGFSIQWKHVSENFPHNGSMFRALFHTMETCFPRCGKLHSALGKPVSGRAGEGAAPSAPRRAKQAVSGDICWWGKPSWRAGRAGERGLMKAARRGRLAPPPSAFFSRFSSPRRGRSRALPFAGFILSGLPQRFCLPPGLGFIAHPPCEAPRQALRGIEARNREGRSTSDRRGGNSAPRNGWQGGVSCFSRSRADWATAPPRRP